MQSKTERRKAFLQPLSIFKAEAKTALTVFASIFIVASAASAQKDSPSLSVFRKNVGVVSSDPGKSSTLTISDANLDVVAGDFDADGRVDIGTFDRSARLWTVRRSGDGSTLVVSFPQQKSSGRPVTVPADYDGDGSTDMAVWSAGAWQIRVSSDGGPVLTQNFGVKGDVPVPADFDGDKKADLAVFRPTENRWYIQSSTNGTVRTVDFGQAGTDLLLPADYTGDGKADIAVYRNSTWLVIDSTTGEEDKFEFGFEDARPVPGDFNHDGEVDFAVYQKGKWYVYDGDRLASYKFGESEDVPLSIVPVRQSMAGR